MNFLGVFLFLIAAMVGISYYVGDIEHSRGRVIDRTHVFYPYGHYQSETETKEIPVNGHVQISIDAINGPINIIGTNESIAKIKITKRSSSKKDFKYIKIQKTLTAGEIKLKTQHLDNNRHKISVGYELHIPHGAVVSMAKTINGSIVIDDVHGAIVTNTANGDITCKKTEGAVEAYSVNGSVSVSVSKLHKDEFITLKTINGGIDLGLSPDISALLNAKTSVGGISSQFHIKKQRSFFVGKEIEGLVGDEPNPHQKINLTTTSGSIQIRAINNDDQEW